MDFSDKATEYEERQRDEAIRTYRRPSNPAITEKRRRVANARAIAGQRDANNLDIVLLGVTCENCDDTLTMGSNDIFCSKDCADDWDLRERARHFAGH